MKQLFLFLCLHIFTCLYAQSQSDIIINEVMANPKGLILLPETEYIELHNTTKQAISLTGWWLVYGQTQVKLSELALPAEGYVVLFRSNRTIQVETNGLQMPLEKFPYQLNNDGKLLQLYDADWALHDEVYYPKALAAVSWERCGNEWISCTDERGGTPGGINSCGTSGNETPEDRKSLRHPSSRKRRSPRKSPRMNLRQPIRQVVSGSTRSWPIRMDWWHCLKPSMWNCITEAISASIWKTGNLYMVINRPS